MGQSETCPATVDNARIISRKGIRFGAIAYRFRRELDRAVIDWNRYNGWYRPMRHLDKRTTGAAYHTR